MSLSVTMSGMKVAQKDLDVIGNNIANAGTDGFKRSVTSFADVFPNDPSASPKTAVGQGAVVSLISRDTSQGSMSSTGKVTDMAISGSGYFTLSAGGNQVYTRAGSFAVDKNGFLTDSSGNKVQMAGDGTVKEGIAFSSANDGTWTTTPPAPITSLTSIQFPVYMRPSDANGAPIDHASSEKPDYTKAPTPIVPGDAAGVETGAYDGLLQSVSIDSNGLISASYSGFQVPYPIGYLAIANFPNPAALQPIGNTDFAASGDSGNVTLSAGGTPGAGTVMSGALEASNVDITNELVKMLKAQQLYNGNARALQTQVEVASRVTDKL